MYFIFIEFDKKMTRRCKKMVKHTKKYNPPNIGFYFLDFMCPFVYNI